MATAPEHLTDEARKRRAEYEASFLAVRRRAADPQFMATMREQMAAMDAGPRPRGMSAEEFLAGTEHP